MYDTMSSSQSNSKLPKSSLLLKYSRFGQRARFQSVRTQMYCEDFDSGAAGTCLYCRRCFPGRLGSWKQQHGPSHSFTSETTRTAGDSNSPFRPSVTLTRPGSEASKRLQYSLSWVATEEQQQASWSYSTAAVGIVSQIIFWEACLMHQRSPCKTLWTRRLRNENVSENGFDNPAKGCHIMPL